MKNLLTGSLFGAAGAVVVGIVHLFRTKHFGKDGFNACGYDRNGRDRKGFDREGFDSQGYDRQGFNRAGWDREGYSRSGFDKDGFNRNGLDRQGFDRFGYSTVGIDRAGMSRQEAENTILQIEELKHIAKGEMGAYSFREALVNIRTGIDHCLMLILRHKTGNAFDDYDCNMEMRIEKCQFYKVLCADDACKLQKARKLSNAIHDLQLRKEYNQVYFCLKSLEELIDRTREYLDVQDSGFYGVLLT